MVVFAQHNLIKDPPFTNIELISCRNLLIYLQPILQRKVLDHFNFSLNPNGLLFLGHSETTGEMADYFTPLNHKWKFYRSKGKAGAFGPELEISKARFSPGRLLRPQFLGPQKAMRFHEEERILDRLLDALKGDYVPLTIVVERSAGIAARARRCHRHFAVPFRTRSERHFPNRARGAFDPTFHRHSKGV
jgi:two-component system CheB/CheR fusion protein